MLATGALGQFCVIINHFIVDANGYKIVSPQAQCPAQCQMKGKTSRKALYEGCECSWLD